MPPYLPAIKPNKMKSENIDKYRGIIVPMITPFNDRGGIDEEKSTDFIRFLLANKTIPFVLGTSGEVYSIPVDERNKLINILIENRLPDVPLIAGMGGLTFNDTIRLGNQYFEWGVDALVLTLPGYFELTDDQVYNYFLELSKQLKGNVILYNIPVVIHNSISISVIERLSRQDNIIGIKDSEFDEERMKESLKLWVDRDDFIYLIGVMEFMYEGLKAGAAGLVPSTANIVPKIFHNMFSFHLQGKYDEVKKIHLMANNILSIYKNGHTLGESIATLKYLASLEDLCDMVTLPPLSGLSESEKIIARRKWEKMKTNYILR
jgi:4-hydroxy-tetrahydrodipicolinate synthase